MQIQKDLITGDSRNAREVQGVTTPINIAHYFTPRNLEELGALSHPK
jgi:hypothetical protein